MKHQQTKPQLQNIMFLQTRSQPIWCRPTLLKSGQIVRPVTSIGSNTAVDFQRSGSSAASSSSKKKKKKKKLLPVWWSGLVPPLIKGLRLGMFWVFLQRKKYPSAIIPVWIFTLKTTVGQRLLQALWVGSFMCLCFALHFTPRQGGATLRHGGANLLHGPRTSMVSKTGTQVGKRTFEVNGDLANVHTAKYMCVRLFHSTVLKTAICRIYPKSDLPRIPHRRLTAPNILLQQHGIQ